MVATLNWCLHHWWVFWFLAIFGVFEWVRDFFVGIARAVASVGENRHRRRMKELRLQRKIVQSQVGGDGSVQFQSAGSITTSRPKPGPCVHRNVVPVVAKDESVVAWLCRTCDEKLPPDWAVREEDL